MKFQLKVKLTKNGKTFAKGSIVTEDQISRYGINQAYLESYTKPRKTKEVFTLDEENLLVDLYLQHADPINKSDNRKSIIHDYRKEYDTHSDNSLEIFINSIKRIDLDYRAEGMAPNRKLVKKLSVIYPDRFMTLDQLDLTLSFKDW